MRASRLTVLAGLFVIAFVVAPGCGGDDEKPKPKADEPGQPVDCDGLTCKAVKLPFGNPPIEACCTDQGGCGLDGTPFEQYGAHFTEKCQALDQPGVLDDHCPPSPPVVTENLAPFSFKGCCTAAGKCGYMLDNVANIVTLGLGCVDSTPFLDAGVPANCGSGAGGAGGGGP